MKITAILLLSLPVVAAAQTIDRHVVASSGKQYSTSVGSMGYTIGEPLTNTLVGGTATFTQGFHQGTINITSVRQQLPKSELLVYPNPTVDVVRIQYNGSMAQWQLHTIDGKLVTQGQKAQYTTAADHQQYVAEMVAGTMDTSLSGRGRHAILIHTIQHNEI